MSKLLEGKFKHFKKKLQTQKILSLIFMGESYIDTFLISLIRDMQFLSVMDKYKTNNYFNIIVRRLDD